MRGTLDDVDIPANITDQGDGGPSDMMFGTEDIITWPYSNVQIIPQHQLPPVRFNAPGKLHREGRNRYTETQDSGVPLTGAPGTNGLGKSAPTPWEGA